MSQVAASTSTPKQKADSGTSPQKLFICVSGIYFFYLYYGYFQEGIYRREETGERFASTQFLLLCQCLVNAALAFLILNLVMSPQKKAKDAKQKAKQLSVPSASAPGYVKSMFGSYLNGHTWMSMISFTYVGAMFCSNAALQYVNYPTQALGKSCKMIPIMAFNVLVNGTRYSALEYAAALLITGGIVIFRVFKSTSKAAGANSTLGLVLLLGSLCLDGLTASNQKAYKKEYADSTSRGAVNMMLQTNLWAILHVGLLSLVTGDAYAGIQYCIDHPHIVTAILKFGLCSACGQCFIFYTVAGPGPLVCSTITTTRKFFTILLSVFLNPGNHLQMEQWGGVALVFAGLGLNTALKYVQGKSTH